MELAADLAPVWTGAHALTPIARVQANGAEEWIAEGAARLERLTAFVAAAPGSWTERRLVIRSHPWAQAGERALRTRVANAPAAIAALNDRRPGKRRVPERSALQEAVAAIVSHYHVQGLLQVQ